MRLNDYINRTLRGFHPHERSIPQPTPKPECNKVLDSGIRHRPINRQAALITRPVKDWASQPPPMPPEKPKTAQDIQIEKLSILIKTERNAHAATKDALGRARQEIHDLRFQLARLHRTVATLQKEIAERDSIIRQLEDIKL